MNTKKTIFTAILALLSLVAIFGFVDSVFAGIGYGCVNHYDVRCAGNGVYWIDSCGIQQDLAQACPYGCNGNKCANQVVYNNYVKHSVKNCNDNNVYWYDSNGKINDLYQVCESCSKGVCVVNELKCDTTQNPIGSTGYCSACNHIGDGFCNCDETSATAPGDCAAQVAQGPLYGLDTSTFCTVGENSNNWSKNITISGGEKLNCLIIVKNLSNQEVKDVLVKADIPTEISTISDAKIDGVVSSENITSGIDLGNLSANYSKIITFSAKAEDLITEPQVKQIMGIASSGSLSGSDSLAVNFKGTIAGASTASLESSSFTKFLKRWYLWILIAIVLIFVFIVIFRRLSTNV